MDDSENENVFLEASSDIFEEDEKSTPLSPTPSYRTPHCWVKRLSTIYYPYLLAIIFLMRKKIRKNMFPWMRNVLLVKMQILI